MVHKKQVNKSHYRFGPYMNKPRWCSVWHQMDEIQKLAPQSVLEIGPGPGVLKAVGALFGITVETLDLDSDLNPDHLGSASAIPLPDAAYDVVCAFQVLEHLPYESSLVAFEEMVRVSRGNVIISLPDAWPAWRYQIHVPFLGGLDLLVPRPRLRAPVHGPDPEHHWEINKRNYPLSRIVADFSRRMSLLKTYRVPEFPYHRFFLFG